MKLVHVLYYNGISYKFEEREMLADANSTDPHDFGLPTDNRVIMVITGNYNNRTYVNGMEVVG